MTLPHPIQQFFSIGEAPLRADEFAELGFSEELVWGKDGA